MVDPNNVDMLELIRKMRNEGNTATLTFTEKDGSGQYCVIVTSVAIARGLHKALATMGLNTEVVGSEVIPMKGRN